MRKIEGIEKTIEPDIFNAEFLYSEGIDVRNVEKLSKANNADSTP
jgi:hypothetical protein